MEIRQFSVTAHLDYDPQSIDAFIDLCELAIASMTCDTSARFMLKTAVDELSLNAIEHGYGKNKGIIFITFLHMGDHIQMDITDEGKGIDPNKVRRNREAQTEGDLYSRGWAFSILDKLTDGLEISHNDPHGARITLHIPVKDKC